jgi:hypothetical protein
MPLVLDGSSWSRDRLVEQLTGLREEHSSMARVFSKVPAGLPNPWAAEEAVALAQQSVALADAVLQSGSAPNDLIASSVNLLYESRNALLHLVGAAKSPPPPFPKPPRKVPEKG